MLTKGVVRGIIVKRSRETAKNWKRKAEKESRLKESTGPWKLNNERKNGTCNFFERLKETYEKQNSTNLWRTSERRYERIKALKKIWTRKRLDTIFREFDPGSGRTLAACLTHASRTELKGACFFQLSGGRVSNAWVTCLSEGDNVLKRTLIPHKIVASHEVAIKGAIRYEMGPRRIS